ncbi:FAR1 DNA binding domain [Dillenia turbinata]|uniref:Protein FAR1-RELATED SEQUENCE n=1 Tax=Dillenia turbinata TaxID=194707 RepID=A0AAN8ZBN4_9MAGN
MGIDLEQPSVEQHIHRDSEDCGGPAAPNLPVIVSGNNGVNLNSSINLEPHDRMEFESKEQAFAFYKQYAQSVGFATIVKASRRSRMSGKFIDAKFVCTRYGNKREPASKNGSESMSVKSGRGRVNLSMYKTDCKACMHVKRMQDGRWVIRSFIKEHNHEIFPEQAYYFRGRGHRNINLNNNDTDAVQALWARTKKMHDTMSRQPGGLKKVENQKNGSKNQFVGAKHLRLDEGDAQVMLENFMFFQEENPNFFYAIDLNDEQCLRNAFWADAKGRLDYESFRDVVFFDTTYIKNEYKLPFAPFIGVNNHCQLLLLGCALIAEETKSTYVWLMRAWLRAMGGRAPIVILTDQDKALKEAVAEVFPDSRHCFCLWQVLSKIQEKLNYVIRKQQNFMVKFNKCIFKSWTDEQFETRWWKMIGRFDLKDDIWLQSLYEDRKQWVPTFMRNIFLGGISTCQRPESINSFLDKYMQRKTNLKDFLDQYKVIIQEKSEEEARADFETWHKQPGLKSPSPFGKQMATLYTHAIFKKFQVEVLGVVACHPKEESKDGTLMTYKVQDFENNEEYIVVWNETSSVVSCLCRSFEYNGFLCRHVMIVLQISGVNEIPSQYILNRWTKDAKNRQATNLGLEMFDTRVERYNDLCRRAFKLSNECSLSQETYKVAFNKLEEALRECESINSSSLQREMEPLPSPHMHHHEEVDQANSNTKKSKNDNLSNKSKTEPEEITVGIHDSWHQMGLSNLRASALDCSYGSHENGQLNSRAPALDGYFSPQHIVQGMGQLNSIGGSREDYYSNHHSMQGLVQLNLIGPLHDGHFVAQQRFQGPGHPHLRPQTFQNGYDIQDSLQDMDESGAPARFHSISSKHLHTKHLPR